jgi:gamma-glutamylcyclotransferase (GGCT)/AIG2-like uncharacterized protein YtfP
VWSEEEVRAADRRLAVYGTLAPGRTNAWMLEPLAGTWTEGVVRGERIAAGWGNTEGYPALRPDPDGDEIAVFLFESADLGAHWARLDAFEGDEYDRVLIEVRCAGRTLLANVYVCR